MRAWVNDVAYGIGWCMAFLVLVVLVIWLLCLGAHGLYLLRSYVG